MSSSNDAAQWLRREIARLERRLEQMRTLLAVLEQRELTPRTGERVEEVKARRKRIARIVTGDSYVRLVFDEPVWVPHEIREFLSEIEQEIRAFQTQAGEEEFVKLSYKEADGAVTEIRYDQLYTTAEVLRARSALRYTADIVYQLLKRRVKPS